MSVQLPATDIVHVRKLTLEGLRIGTTRSGTRSLQFLLYLEVLKRKSGTERLEMTRSKFQRQMILVVAITITCITIIIMFTETMWNVIAGPGRVHEEKLVDTFRPVDEAMRYVYSCDRRSTLYLSITEEQSSRNCGTIDDSITGQKRSIHWQLTQA